MHTIEAIAIYNGERVLRVSEGRAVIIHRWFGRKTAKSNKPTWNEDLIARGPVAFLLWRVEQVQSLLRSQLRSNRWKFAWAAADWPRFG